jgi:hypothetical protein
VKIPTLQGEIMQRNWDPWHYSFGGFECWMLKLFVAEKKAIKQYSAEWE